MTFEWHTSEFYPDNPLRPILCVTANGKMMTLKSIRDYRDWLWTTEKYNISLWIFQDTIIPDEIFNKEDNEEEE